jgi:hypothetical protein
LRIEQRERCAGAQQQASADQQAAVSPEGLAPQALARRLRLRASHGCASSTIESCDNHEQETRGCKRIDAEDQLKRLRDKIIKP